jgi:colicin import membrane protein
MSSVSTSRPQTPPHEADPFRYGWRFVRVPRPDGTEELEQIPLTLEDVLHPEVGDFIVQTDAHDSERAYLKSVSKARLQDDPSAAVLSDCRVDWNIPGVRPLGPDFAVFFGVRRHIDWSTFDVAEEGARPGLVTEITSPETRTNDVEIKVDYYHRARVPQYVIADVSYDGDERRIELIDYRYAPDAYQQFQPNERGWIWLVALRLWLGLTRDRQGGYLRLACFDPDTGQEIGDYAAVSRALAEEQEARLEAEQRAAAEAERAAAESDARIQAEQRAKAYFPHITTTFSPIFPSFVHL